MSTLLVWSAETRDRFVEKAGNVLSVVTAEMSERLMELAPTEVNCCLAALFAIGFADYKFYSAVCRTVRARQQGFGPGHFAAFLCVLSEMRMVHNDLFQAAGLASSVRAREMRATEALRLLRAFAKCNQPHEGLCQAIG